jgi:hypothetical protein
VSQRIASQKNNPIWHKYIVEEFRRNANESDPKKIEKQLQLAKDYANLIQDVHYEKASNLFTPILTCCEGGLLICNRESHSICVKSRKFGIMSSFILGVYVSLHQVDSPLLSSSKAQVIDDFHALQELLLSYNIGIDRDTRQKQMIHNTAALVGLRLPVLPPDDAGK